MFARLAAEPRVTTAAEGSAFSQGDAVALAVAIGHIGADLLLGEPRQRAELLEQQRNTPASIPAVPANE